jgi:small redox-active disulfide protein 2
MLKLQILGTRCPKCQKLAAVTEEAARSLGVVYELEKVTDVNAIVNFGVMVTPALAVNGTVKVAGKVPSVEQVKALLQQNAHTERSAP